MVQKDILLKVLDALDSQQILYMIVGSFASNYWGRPRNTHDADLVVEILPTHAAGLAKLLEDEFYAPDFVIQEAAERGDHFNVIHFQTGFKVDFWVRKNTAYEQICFQRRFQGTMFGRSVWLTSVEDIILSKLTWYQLSPVLDRQLQDVLEVYEIQEHELDQEYLNRWAITLGVVDLLENIRQQAAQPPPK